MQSALAEIKEANSLDKVRENALKAHQEAEQEIQAEVCAVLSSLIANVKSYLFPNFEN